MTAPPSRLLRTLALTLGLAVATAACGADQVDQRTGPAATGPGSSSPGTTAAPAPPPTFPACDDVPRISAPAHRYRPEPVYVGNEQPTEAVKAWAAPQTGFVDVWLDRDHNGWITVAFTGGSGDGDARQRELEARFPGVGAVVVEVSWTKGELEGLQQRVTDALRPTGWSFATGSLSNKGVVTVSLGVRSSERLAKLVPFAGEPLCVEGADPATAIADGPQPRGGEGWRLLGDDLAGMAYRTGVATTPEQYAALWTRAGLSGSRPDVDFTSEIVVWLGAVYGSSCPIRLDGVEVDGARRLVFGRIVVPGNPAVCTSDARPHAYVVALERSLLPRGGFGVQLRAEDPPRGVPEERTVVAVDLSAPGAVATDAEIGPDPTLVGPAADTDRRSIVGSGAVVSIGDPWRYRIEAGCGATVLGVVNGVLWESAAPVDGGGLPAQWQAVADPAGDVIVDITVTADPPALRAVANGYTVAYVPSTRDRTTAVCPAG